MRECTDIFKVLKKKRKKKERKKTKEKSPVNQEYYIWQIFSLKKKRKRKRKRIKDLHKI